MIGFGLFLVASGVLGWAAAGFAAEAKTAILSGAVSGGLMLACGALVARGPRGLARAAGAAGTALPIVFAGAFAWRAIVAWMETFGGEAKLYVAALLSTMTVAAVVTFGALLKPPAGARTERRSVA